MEIQDNFTLQELEQLCQAYLDCRLSRLQEKELELVLLSSDISSPILTKVRSLMGLSTLMVYSKERTIKKIIRALKYSGTAACIAVIAIFTMYFFGEFRSSDEENIDIYVCVDGKELNGYVARAVSSDTQEETMSMFQSIISDAEEEQRLSEQYMNNIIE